MSKRPGDHGYAANWCIHYRGISSDGKGGLVTSCHAGIDYASFPDRSKQPCFLDNSGQSKPGAVHCPQLRQPTPDEIAAHKTWLCERIVLMGVVMNGIGPWRRAHKGKSASEVVDCPACGGRLHLSISAYNGHVHGYCETEGCVSWME